MSSTDGWVARDKLAAVAALVLATGYVYQPVQAAVVGSLTPVLAPLAAMLPFAAFVLVLAGTTATSTALFQVRLRNQARIEELQARLESLREGLDPGEGDLDPELQAEMTSTWTALLKQNLRPMGWSMLVTVPAFLWLRWAVASPTVAVASTTAFVPLVGHVAWTATVVGPLKLWLVWYLGASISSGYLGRKVARRLAV